MVELLPICPIQDIWTLVEQEIYANNKLSNVYQEATAFSYFGADGVSPILTVNEIIYLLPTYKVIIE